MEKFNKVEMKINFGDFYKNIRELEKQSGFTPQHKSSIAKQFEQEKDAETYLNDKYQVRLYRELYQMPYFGVKEFTDVISDNMMWLSIKRLDQEPIHDWRDLMEIKNQIAGEDHEAVELYPKKSRVVDTANQYHLWVLKNPVAFFPFGFPVGVQFDKSVHKTKQRSFK